MKPEVDELCTELSKEVLAVGRNIASRTGHCEQDFDDLIAALKHHARTLRIIKSIEYNVKK